MVHEWRPFHKLNMLQFIYTFVTAGIVLILMNLLFIVSRMKRWTVFNIFRAVLNFLIGLGLALVSLISLNRHDASQFQSTPWILPTLCLTFFFILVVNHLPKPPPFLSRRKRQNSKAESTGLLGGPRYGPPQAQWPGQPHTTTEYNNGQYNNGPYDNGQYNNNENSNGQYRNSQYNNVPLYAGT